MMREPACGLWMVSCCFLLSVACSPSRAEQADAILEKHKAKIQECDVLLADDAAAFKSASELIDAGQYEEGQRLLKDIQDARRCRDELMKQMGPDLKAAGFDLGDPEDKRALDEAFRRRPF